MRNLKSDYNCVEKLTIKIISELQTQDRKQYMRSDNVTEMSSIQLIKQRLALTIP